MLISALSPAICLARSYGGNTVEDDFQLAAVAV